MKNTRALRESLAMKNEVIIEVPWPKGPRGGTSIEAMKRGLRARYGLFIDTDPNSEYEGCVFYNGDLRSITGNVIEGLDFGGTLLLSISPRWFACKWGDKREYDEQYGETYWKNLLNDAISVKANN